MTLPETGVPFVFMNAAGTQRDLETIVHEAGHAVHSLSDAPCRIISTWKYLRNGRISFYEYGILLSIEGWMFFSDDDKSVLSKVI